MRAQRRPEKRAELRLVVNAGSILEDEDQRGLAHFVEHMAFNGTEGFEKQQIMGLINTIYNRIIYRMKVTAILPDNLVREVRHLARGKNLTESLIIALREWSNLRRVRDLNNKVEKWPLEFEEGVSAEGIRELNRKS